MQLVVISDELLFSSKGKQWLAQQPSFSVKKKWNEKNQRNYYFCPGTWQMGKQSVGFYGSVNKEMKCGTPGLKKSVASDPHRLPCLILSAYWFAQGNIGIKTTLQDEYYGQKKTVWQELEKWGLSCICNEKSSKLHCIRKQECSIFILFSNSNFSCDVA